MLLKFPIKFLTLLNAPELTHDISENNKKRVQQCSSDNVANDLEKAYWKVLSAIAFDEHANDALKLDFGLGTSNFLLVRRNLEQWNVHPAFVMTPVNIKGLIRSCEGRS
jgi:hypothetical protein